MCGDIISILTNNSLMKNFEIENVNINSVENISKGCQPVDRQMIENAIKLKLTESSSEDSLNTINSQNSIE